MVPKLLLTAAPEPIPRQTGAIRRACLSVEGETAPAVEALEAAVDHVVLVEIDLNESQ